MQPLLALLLASPQPQALGAPGHHAMLATHTPRLLAVFQSLFLPITSLALMLSTPLALVARTSSLAPACRSRGLRCFFLFLAFPVGGLGGVVWTEHARLATLSMPSARQIRTYRKYIHKSREIHAYWFGLLSKFMAD